MSELTDKIVMLGKAIDASTAHFGASTHEEKQDIHIDNVRGLAWRMKEIIAMVEGPQVPQIPEEPTAAELGAAARAAGEPPLVTVPPPSGIIRSGE